MADLALLLPGVPAGAGACPAGAGCQSPDSTVSRAGGIFDDDVDDLGAGFAWDAWVPDLPPGLPADAAPAPPSLEAALLADCDAFLAETAGLLDAERPSGGDLTGALCRHGGGPAWDAGGLPAGCSSATSSRSQLQWLPAGRSGSVEAEQPPRPVVADFQPREASGEPDPAPEPCARRAPPPRSAAAARAARGSSPSPPPEPRRCGRPRIYDTKAAAQPLPPGAQPPPRKGKRGAKPKYLYSTSAQALAMRRERNRSTAIDSYYRRKARTEQLQQEMEALQREQAALQQLDELSSSQPAYAARIGQLLAQETLPEEALAQLGHYSA